MSQEAQRIQSRTQHPQNPHETEVDSARAVSPGVGLIQCQVPVIQIEIW